MWRVLRRLQGGKSSEHKNEVLHHNGRNIMDKAGKANAFMKEYSRVSDVKIPRANRNMKARVATALRRSKTTPALEGDQAVQLSEVNQAIDQLDANTSQGPDHVHNKMIKHLPQAATIALLNLIRASISQSNVPGGWRTGKIIPIIKKGKDPAAVSSYRPICLTAVLSKLTERIINNRLLFILESKGLLSDYQAGFRPNKSTEDQLLRLSQSVSDGFEEKKRTVLTLLDFEKAYDKVWKDGLIFKMVKMGLPIMLIRWVQQWLTNRQAFVEYEGIRSKKKVLKQGLPQGAVLSPALFLIYINDVVDLIHDAEVSLFADDIAIWATSGDIEEARSRVQLAVNSVYQWSNEWLMSLSIGKCSTTLFSLNPADSNKRPTISINGLAFAYDQNPTFLGVTYDTKLNFLEHTARLTSKVKNRVKLISAVAGSDWGFSMPLLRTTYIALIRSCLEYGSPAWWPWLSDAQRKKLERCQNEAARRITVTVSSTPTESLRIEAGLEPLSERLNGNSIIAFDKSMRTEDNNQRRVIATKECRKRLKKRSWRDAALSTWKEIFPDADAAQLWRMPHLMCPWHRSPNIRYEIIGAKTDNREQNLQLASASLADNDQYDWVIYTDGSASGGLQLGGAAAIVTGGAEEHPVALTEVLVAAGRWCSSFQTEMMAIKEALCWVDNHSGSPSTTRIATDSQASIKAIKYRKLHTKNPILREIHILLARITATQKQISFTWIPSHCGCPGNEMADQAAALAALRDQAQQPWLFEVSKARIRDHFNTQSRSRQTHERTKKVYSPAPIQYAEEAKWSRRDAVTLRRMRTGHLPDTLAYKFRIGTSDIETCRLCGLDPESTDHILLECPALRRLRQRNQVTILNDMCRRPKQCLEIWRRFSQLVADLVEENTEQPQNTNADLEALPSDV